jgi:hypothetical protein
LRTSSLPVWSMVSWEPIRRSKEKDTEIGDLV